jgi:hypothetical protein
MMDNNKPDGVAFEDAETNNNFISQDKVSFRSIILNHLNNILRYSSVEWRGGFYEERPMTAQGGVIRTYIDDSREIYSNAVESLADCLYPYFDKKMKDAENECVKELKESYDIYSQEVELKVNDDKYVERLMSKDKKAFYRDDRVKISRKLFRHLCDFLHRKKYLEVGSLSDE